MAKLEHFAIYAADTIALKDFYVDLLSLRVTMESGTPPGYFLADEAGMAVEIIPRPAGEAAVNQRWVCHVAFWVDQDQYDTIRSNLLARGVTFESDTSVSNESMRTDFFNDPEGNRVQIVWRQQSIAS